MTRKEFLRIASRGTAASLAAGATIGTMAGSPAAAEPGSGAEPGPGTNDQGPGTKDQLPSGATAAVVDFIAHAGFDRMPDNAVVEAKRCLIDGFGVILAGATVHGSAIVREHVKASASRGESTLLGPERMSATAAQAALANGASGHAMDYDDTQLSTTPDRVFGLLTHPTVPALAASLAIGERLGVSGAAFLDAFLIGFEVECKIAEAINPNHYQRGFHSTGTIGTFGAAASAARLMKLAPAETAHALGIAASMSAGIRVNFGSMTKPLHAGRAAE